MSHPLPSPYLYNPTTNSPLLPALARLHATCISVDNTMATFLPPLSHEKILASWREWSNEVSAGRRIIVIQPAAASSASDEVAGVVSLYMPETETGNHRGEVGRLLVSPDYRKRGLARVLMAALEGEARARRRWMLVRCDFF